MLLSKMLTVVLGQMVIFAENVLLNLQHTALGHTGRMATRLAFAVVQIVILLFWRKFFVVFIEMLF